MAKRFTITLVFSGKHTTEISKEAALARWQNMLKYAGCRAGWLNAGIDPDSIKIVEIDTLPDDDK